MATKKTSTKNTPVFNAVTFKFKQLSKHDNVIPEKGQLYLVATVTNNTVITAYANDSLTEWVCYGNTIKNGISRKLVSMNNGDLFTPVGIE